MNPIQNIYQPQDLRNHIPLINLPQPNSHKGDNGKLLIIGGSELFHAASSWSLEIASKFVDMVFYSSIPSNNQLIAKAKQNFWNGIVIPRTELENYIDEANCILIGPGMERVSHSQTDPSLAPTKKEWQDNTFKITNYLLKKHPHKKWVIDAGALQMLEPQLLNKNCIITPHEKELNILLKKIKAPDLLGKEKNWLKISQALNQTHIIAKGPVDTVVTNNQIYYIHGGNAGMTKGGTGDVLAGLVAGLYSTNSADKSCLWGSYLNKKAGDYLFETVGPFYNASDLVTAIPPTLWQIIKKLKQNDI